MGCFYYTSRSQRSNVYITPICRFISGLIPYYSHIITEPPAQGITFSISSDDTRCVWQPRLHVFPILEDRLWRIGGAEGPIIPLIHLNCNWLISDYHLIADPTTPRTDLPCNYCKRDSPPSFDNAFPLLQIFSVEAKTGKDQSPNEVTRLSCSTSLHRKRTTCFLYYQRSVYEIQRWPSRHFIEAAFVPWACFQGTQIRQITYFFSEEGRISSWHWDCRRWNCFCGGVFSGNWACRFLQRGKMLNVDTI